MSWKTRSSDRVSKSTQTGRQFPRYNFVHFLWFILSIFFGKYNFAFKVFIGGEFIGGCDIVTEMYQSGELQELLEKTMAE